MKKIKLLKYLGATFLCASTPLALLTSCGDKKPEPEPEPEPAVPEITSKKVIAAPFFAAGYYGYEQLPVSRLIVTQFNNSTVPYVDVDNYVAMSFHYEEMGGHAYTSETKDTKTTITNKYNNATCVIDYVEQTISFSDYDSYLNCDLYASNPLASGVGGGEKFFIMNDTASEYTCPSEPYVIDLKKYNIVAYYDEFGHGYLPYDLFRNIITPYATNWDSFFFNGVAFYQIVDSNDVDTIKYLYGPVAKQQTIVNKDYMEFTYNLLALTIDNKFGLPERPLRTQPGTTHKFFENGAYEALEPYHEDLVSLDGDTSNSTLNTVFTELFDDGGHAGYSGINFLCSTPSSITRGPETLHTGQVFNWMDSARNVAAGGKWEFEDPYDDDWYMPPAAPTQKIEILDSTTDAQDIAWVTMDSFVPFDDYYYVVHDDEWEEFYALVGDGYNDLGEPDTDNEIPYQYDTIIMTMYLQKLVNADDSKIKYVVLDLTNNGGGAVYAEHFLASYLCGNHNTCQPQNPKYGKGGVTRALYNPHTNAFGKYTLYADVNRDGVYNEKDYLPDDVKLCVLTSEGSFSCANMLPNDLYICNPECKFAGYPSGGGACYVDSNVHLGLGNVFRSSSNFHSLWGNSTINNKTSVEGGVPIEKYQSGYLLGNDEPSASDYFNRTAIINWLKTA